MQAGVVEVRLTVIAEGTGAPPGTARLLLSKVPLVPVHVWGSQTTVHHHTHTGETRSGRGFVSVLYTCDIHL